VVGSLALMGRFEYRTAAAQWRHRYRGPDVADDAHIAVSGAGSLAHIGNVPVEEWLPFLVPIIALYLYGRRRERRRRAAVSGLPEPSDALDEGTIAAVLTGWRTAGYEGLGSEHLALLYPPGPDGMSVEELVQRTHRDTVTVERLLDEMEELEYVELDLPHGAEGRRAWLTLSGHGLVDATEDALLRALAHAPRPE
jgi:hypothetical protein